MPAFPPVPVYPTSIDSDRTLYKVYNTSESVLSQDCEPWADEISIVPTENDIWGENGFANLSGEMIYYDAVERNEDNQIVKFKYVLRGINGFSNFNAAGTWIRGTVVAEHHNQLVTAILKTEKFIGYDFDTDESTLDWRIRNLNDQLNIPDDFACPEVQFTFNVIENNPSNGILISYNILITGQYGSAIISFGDGNTTTVLSGTYRYSVGAKIDPSVTVQNGDCQIVQTPIERSEVNEPDLPGTIPPFTIPVPIPPTFPDFIFPSVNVPSFDLVPPPFVNSCLDLTPLGAVLDLPSLIFSAIIDAGANINISINFPSLMLSFLSNISVNGTISVEVPSGVTIPIGDFPEVPSIPIVLDISSIPSFDLSANISFGLVPSIPDIQFAPPPSIPSIEFAPAPTFPDIGFETPPLISVDAATFPTIITVDGSSIPTTITLAGDCNLPDTITITGGDTVPTVINVDGGDTIPTTINVIPPGSFPTIYFDTPPVISVDWGTPPSIVCTCVVVCPSSEAMAMRRNNYVDEGSSDIEIQYDFAGIPTVIQILPPENPIRVENDIPSVIRVEMPEMNDIKIIGVEDIPREIKILPPDTNDMIFRVEVEQPRFESIKLDIQDSIKIDLPDSFPKISFDKDSFPEIKVTGIPDSIAIEHNIPTKIEIDWSEAAKNFSIPPVSVQPLEVKLNFTFDRLTSEHGDEVQCFAILPCGKK